MINEEWPARLAAIFQFFGCIIIYKERCWALSETLTGELILKDNENGCIIFIMRGKDNVKAE